MDRLWLGDDEQGEEEEEEEEEEGEAQETTPPRPPASTTAPAAARNRSSSVCSAESPAPPAKPSPSGAPPSPSGREDVRVAVPGLKHPAEVRGATPLIRAAVGGLVGAARKLIAAGAPLEATDQGRDGRFSALQWASLLGHEHVVRALLLAGAEVDAAVFGETPLMFACRHGHLGAARELLLAGADRRRKTALGATALSIARARGHAAVEELLLQG